MPDFIPEPLTAVRWSQPGPGCFQLVDQTRAVSVFIAVSSNTAAPTPVTGFRGLTQDVAPSSASPSLSILGTPLGTTADHGGVLPASTLASASDRS